MTVQLNYLLTNQEAFDEVWNWFVVNKNPQALSDKYLCVYRGLGNTKCAAGVLIPDERYNTEWDDLNGKKATEIAKDIPEWAMLNPSLLVAMQEAHDYSSRGVEFTQSIEENLRKVALQYNLSIPGSANEGS